MENKQLLIIVMAIILGCMIISCAVIFSAKINNTSPVVTENNVTGNVSTDTSTDSVSSSNPYDSALAKEYTQSGSDSVKRNPDGSIDSSSSSGGNSGDTINGYHVGEKTEAGYEVSGKSGDRQIDEWYTSHPNTPCYA